MTHEEPARLSDSIIDLMQEVDAMTPANLAHQIGSAADINETLQSIREQVAMNTRALVALAVVLDELAFKGADPILDEAIAAGVRLVEGGGAD